MINEEYIEAIDMLCDNTCKVTAQDILNRVRQSEGNIIPFRAEEEKWKDRMEHNVSIHSNSADDDYERDNIRSNSADDDRERDDIDEIYVKVGRRKSKKQTAKKGRMLRVAVACITILLIPSIAFAEGGKQFFSNLFKEYFKDDVTAEIVDEGHLGELNMRKSSEDGKFDVLLKAVTGDDEHVVILMDITVNDPEIVECKDNLYLEVYSLGVPQYDNMKNLYAPCEGYAQKDESVDNLYHVAIDGAPAWIKNGEDTVVQISKIESHINDPDGKKRTYDTDIEFRFTTPINAIKPVNYVFYDRFDYFEHGGIKYYPTIGMYGQYQSEMKFEYNYIGSEIAHGETDFEVLDATLHENWLEIAQNLILDVDGEKYNVIEIFYTYCDPANNECNVNVYFPSIDYENAKEVSLKYDGKEIKLKGK